MTVNIKKNKLKMLLKNYYFLIIILFLIFLTVFKSNEIKGFVIKGIRLCYMNIVPTLFPFIIFSDIILSTTNKSKSKILKSDFVLPMMLGFLCGFPIGAICVKDLYLEGKIEKEKAEFLIPICSVPSLTFIISGVGGILNNTYYGFLLWISVILSSLICFLLICKKRKNIEDYSEITRQNFDFAKSIKNCGYTMLSICSFIIFFSVINGLACSFLDNDIIKHFISCILEVGNASFSIASDISLSLTAKMIFLCFALSFSGLSVFMQILSVTSDTNLSCKKYIYIKLLQSLICAVVLIIILKIFA